MRYLTYAANTKMTGLMLLILACTATPSARAQKPARPVQKAIRVELDGSSFLGIQMEDVTANNMAKYKLTGERGVIVRAVEKGSPAETAKIQENDVILEFSGMPVLSTMQLARMVRETPVGRKVDIVVSRDGRKQSLTAEIGKSGGSPSLGRNFELRPGDRDGFDLFGPNGRTFEFRVPRGEGFFYGMPNLGEGEFFSEKPRLGVTLEPLTDQMAEFLGVSGKKGLLVTTVEQSSPAASKLKAGDVITQADGQTVDNPDSLARIVRGKNDGVINLKVIRDKKEISIAVDLPKTDSARDKRGYRL